MGVLFTTKTIHFVGIGGIGMSGIAEILLRMNFPVQGSDLKESAQTARLRELGAKIFVGHRSENVRGADVVVYSSACQPSNPELSAALQWHIPVVQRGEMLSELMRMKFGIAVAGSHGKTTTTSMVGQIIHDAGLDPTVVVGGRVALFDSNARHGQGRLLIAEADESDGSFLHLNPALAVVTNIDREHMNHYSSMETLRETFLEFCNKVPFYGAAFVCTECPSVNAILPRIRRKVATYGFSPQADLFAVDLRPHLFGTEFEVMVRQPVGAAHTLGTFRLQMAGKHNVLNALAAIGIGQELNIPTKVIVDALAAFTGVDRRMQFLVRNDHLWLLDDYGHHPTEIRATLSALREHRKGRVTVLFQPHRFTRTRDLWIEFARAFRDIDVLYLMDIYAASEEKIANITSERLAQDIQAESGCDVRFVGSLSQSAVIDRIERELRSNDTILTLGAGVTYEYARALKARIESRTCNDQNRDVNLGL